MEEHCDFDIGNLMCYDSATFSTPGDSDDVNKALDELAAKNAQKLVARLFVLPTEPPPYGNGRVATLPEPTTHLPREKPIPKPREATTWEKFAKLKGIRKRKKDKVAYDEQTGEWRRTYGYKKANDINDTWAIPAKAGENDGLDPWTRAQKEKKERVAHNKKRQMQNLQAASGDRLPGTIDLSSSNPAMLKKGKKKKKHVEVALEFSQKSTASMGKFDNKLKYEPEIKKKSKPKRDAEFQRSHKTEKQSSLKLLEKVVGKEEHSIDVNKAVNIAQQEEEARKRAKKGRAGKKKKSKQ
mmetsp:Transcript_11753/g.21489  ORF Transcript_11753/g.21489 Transcript_11753/m.21489 type:complete len:297 (+) Transcript_11753:19-909(+)